LLFVVVKIQLLILIVLYVLGVSVVAQVKPGTPTLSINKPDMSATLISEFPIVNSEDRSSQFDAFFSEISKTPGSTGYVLLFCGKKCRYDEIVAHMRGIEVKIALRNFDRSRLVLQNAGFLSDFRTQLWLVPPGAFAPQAVSEFNVNEVEFTKPGRYPFEAYDCCDDYTDVWRKLTKKKP
jgi:hypothetical protein